MFRRWAAERQGPLGGQPQERRFQLRQEAVLCKHHLWGCQLRRQRRLQRWLQGGRLREDLASDAQILGGWVRDHAAGPGTTRVRTPGYTQRDSKRACTQRKNGVGVGSADAGRLTRRVGGLGRGGWVGAFPTSGVSEDPRYSLVSRRLLRPSSAEGQKGPTGGACMRTRRVGCWSARDLSAHDAVDAVAVGGTIHGTIQGAASAQHWARLPSWGQPPSSRPASQLEASLSARGQPPSMAPASQVGASLPARGQSPSPPVTVAAPAALNLCHPPPLCRRPGPVPCHTIPPI
eukprot:360081-Chlamydomonas_euryale.AAC.4